MMRLRYRAVKANHADYNTKDQTFSYHLLGSLIQARQEIWSKLHMA